MAEFPYVECFPQGWKKVRGGALHQMQHMQLAACTPCMRVDKSAIASVNCRP
jgi:hypothetical protein